MCDLTKYFNRGGTIILTLSFDAFKSDCDKLVDFGDDKKVWICDYKEPQNQETNTDDWHLEIEYSSLKIKPTNKVSTITAQLYDKDDNELIDGIEYEWTITSNVDEYLTIKKNGNTLNISLAKNCTAYGEKIIIHCMSKYTGQSNEIELEVAEVW